MSENNGAMSGEIQSSVIKEAIASTPKWVFAFGGMNIVLTICVVAILQGTGMAGPLQRVVNARAAGIERAAESIDKSAATLNGLAAMVDSFSVRMDEVEKRLDRIDKFHKSRNITTDK
jgi:hypothetical protein